MSGRASSAARPRSGGDPLSERRGCLLLKVPKREIFDRLDFHDFYTIKSSWVGDLAVKLLTYYFYF
jgi:hypothetical protein